MPETDGLKNEAMKHGLLAKLCSAAAEAFNRYRVRYRRGILPYPKFECDEQLICCDMR